MATMRTASSSSVERCRRCLCCLNGTRTLPLITFAPDLQVSAQGVEPEGSDKGAELHNQLLQQATPTRTFRYLVHYAQVLVTGVFTVIPRVRSSSSLCRSSSSESAGAVHIPLLRQGDNLLVNPLPAVERPL